MERHYYLEPIGLFDPDGWPGAKGSDFLGEDNFGTPEKPVKFSAGSLSWLIYQNEKTIDPNDTSTSTHKIHLIGSKTGELTTFWVGPQNWNGKRCQGADFLYLQKNSNRPNRKVEVIIIAQGRVELCYAPHNYSKELVKSWQGPVEGSVILSSPTSYIDYFDIQDVLINANYKNQGYCTEEGCETRGYKLHGIQVRAKTGRIVNCDIINCGSTSATVGNYISNECFPINVYSIEPEELAWEIIDCRVEAIHSVNGGYYTAIMPCMFTLDPGPRPETFFDMTSKPVIKTACLVEGCEVIGNGNGNGIGTAGADKYASRGVEFRRNTIRYCAISSQFDTGSIREIGITDNHFVQCCVAVQLGTPTGGVVSKKSGAGNVSVLVPSRNDPTFHRNFLIERNHISIGNQEISVGENDFVRRAGMILRNNSAGIVWRDNHITSPYGLSYREVCPSAIDPYYPAYYGTAGPGNPCMDPWMRDPRLTREIKAV